MPSNSLHPATTEGANSPPISTSCEHNGRLESTTSHISTKPFVKRATGGQKPLFATPSQPCEKRWGHRGDRADMLPLFRLLCENDNGWLSPVDVPPPSSFVALKISRRKIGRTWNGSCQHILK